MVYELEGVDNLIVNFNKGTSAGLPIFKNCACMCVCVCTLENLIFFLYGKSSPSSV